MAEKCLKRKSARSATRSPRRHRNSSPDGHPLLPTLLQNGLESLKLLKQSVECSTKATVESHGGNTPREYHRSVPPVAQHPDMQFSQLRWPFAPGALIRSHRVGLAFVCLRDQKRIWRGLTGKETDPAPPVHASGFFAPVNGCTARHVDAHASRESALWVTPMNQIGRLIHFSGNISLEARTSRQLPQAPSAVKRGH
jgi:hypothetical protein